ncbi:hypothetical protein [Candidatus Halocynthiibacter alkanivorans]|uniref:hypothetical protein n=1 Tax=Candidatus Halocynthiibacter alkanivorans TaxID=2267619 RepID=UPI000DF15FFF|nr:hypothetical protein [Candidatus Halocynthiibacter alkanivorans]
MKNIVIAISFAAVGAISTPSAARAQAATFDSAQVTAVCAASSTQCQALVAQIIAQLKVAELSAAAINTQLGVLASSIVTAAQETPAVAAALADTLRTVAVASTDPTQAEQIREVATIASEGGAGSVDTTTAVGASPA